MMRWGKKGRRRGCFSLCAIAWQQQARSLAGVRGGGVGGLWNHVHFHGSGGKGGGGDEEGRRGQKKRMTCLRVRLPISVRRRGFKKYGEEVGEKRESCVL